MKNLFHTESAFQRDVCDVGAARDSVRFASHHDPVFARKDVSVIRKFHSEMIDGCCAVSSPNQEPASGVAASLMSLRVTFG